MNFRPYIKGKILSETRGSVAVIVAVTLPVLIGMAGLSLEYGSALVIRSDNQRIVDASVHAAAVAYAQFDGDDDEKMQAARHAANSIAKLNGIDPDDLDLKPLNETDIEAVISGKRSLLLSRVIDNRAELDVVVRAVAKLGVTTAGNACLLALKESNGSMKIFGNASVKVEGCTISGNGALAVSGVPLSNCSSPIKGDVSGCLEWRESPVFPDPFNISWTQAKLLCEEAGRAKTKLEDFEYKKNDAKILMPSGPHCIEESVKLTGNRIIESAADGVSLFFAPGVELDIAGGFGIRLTPAKELDVSILGGEREPIEGLLFYGPEADLRMRGNSSNNNNNEDEEESSISFGCFGITMRTVDIGGTPSLTMKGDCPDETDSGGFPTMAKVRLLQ